MAIQEAETGVHPDNSKLVIDPDFDGEQAVVVDSLSSMTPVDATPKEEHAQAVYDAVVAGGDPPEPSAAPQTVPAAPAPEPQVIPSVWVTFEIEGFGEHRAPYHDVIRNGNNLVLVYDKTVPGGQRFFPRANEHPIGLNIDGSDKALMVFTTGIEFEDRGREYCVLLVEQEADIQDD